MAPSPVTLLRAYAVIRSTSPPPPPRCASHVQMSYTRSVLHPVIVHLSVHSFVQLSINPSFRTPVHLSVYPPVRSFRPCIRRFWSCQTLRICCHRYTRPITSEKILVVGPHRCCAILTDNRLQISYHSILSIYRHAVGCAAVYGVPIVACRLAKRGVGSETKSVLRSLCLLWPHRYGWSV